MPTIIQTRGYRFFFYSNEGSPRERIHVHVRAAGSEAKIWLEPDVAVAESFSYNAKALREIVKIVSQRGSEIIEAWHDHFGN